MESCFLSKTNRKPPGLTFTFMNDLVLFTIVIVLINDWTYFSSTLSKQNRLSYPEMTSEQLFAVNVLWSQFENGY